MPQQKHSIKVPKIMQDIYQEITTITDDVCCQYLNDEYKILSRYAAAALCRKKTIPSYQLPCKNMGVRYNIRIGIR